MADTREIAVKVQRLRVSYFAAHMHEHVHDVLDPSVFTQRLCDLASVDRLKVQLPFKTPVDRADVAWRFWSRITDRKEQLSPPEKNPNPYSEATFLRKRLVPLRSPGEIEIGDRQTPPHFEDPRLEAFLHPFGWVVVVTVGFVWVNAVPLSQAVQDLNDLEYEGTVRIKVGRRWSDSPLAMAAENYANSLSKRLADDEAWVWEPENRLATVIDATVDGAPTEMPSVNDPLHRALHGLSWGDNPAVDPADAFVARYRSTSGKFDWVPTDLVYVLGVGTSSLLLQAVADRSRARGKGSTARWHRHLTLLQMYLSGTVGLIRSRPDVDGREDRKSWSKLAAERVLRLCIPDPAAPEYWGLETRRYLERTNSMAQVEQRGGASKEALKEPPYPRKAV